jgi:hypothetical protein
MPTNKLTGCSRIFLEKLIIAHPVKKFCFVPPDSRSGDSVVRIATSSWLDDRGVGVRIPVGSRIFSSPCRPDPLWGPPNLLSNGYRGVKRQEREDYHSPAVSAEVKKMWTGDNFTFLT